MLQKFLFAALLGLIFVLVKASELKFHEKDISYLEPNIKKGYKVLVIMRGLPGSGKSTLARFVVNRTMPGADVSKHVFGSDEFFMVNGVYVFNQTLLSKAHKWNQDRVKKAMENGWSPILVDNTNLKAVHMKNYASAGVDNGYIVETLESGTPWRDNPAVLKGTNVHSVPESKIRSMSQQYERDISGEKLLKMFNLSYEPNKQPPQLRALPPL